MLFSYGYSSKVVRNVAAVYKLYNCEFKQKCMHYIESINMYFYEYAAIQKFRIHGFNKILMSDVGIYFF